MRPFHAVAILSILIGAANLSAQAAAAKTAAKPVSKAAAKKKDLKKPGAEPDSAASEVVQLGEGNEANNYGRAWKRSQLDLRVGLYGPLIIPIGQASQVLNMGFGGSLWGSIETSFIKLPKSRIFANTLLMYEFSFYKATGTSVASKIGKDTDADYVTNAGAIGKAYDVQFAPSFTLRFIPFVGAGLTNITSDTQTPVGTVRAVSGDIIAKYGFVAAYDFNRRWQAILVVDHYIYFEEKIGMSLRVGLGATMMIF